MNKKILITVSDEMFDQVEDVRKKLGHMSISETGRYAFAVLIKRELNNYLEIQQKRLKNKEIIIPEITSKKKKKIDQKAKICASLKGVVEEGENGNVCIYTAYEELPGNKIEETMQKIPFDMLGDDIIEYQYKTLTGGTGKEAKDKIKGILRNE